MRWQFSTFALYGIHESDIINSIPYAVFRRFLDLVVTRFLMPGDKVPQTTWFTQHNITIENKAEQGGPDRSGQFEDFLTSSGQMSEREKKGRTVSDTVWWIKGVQTARSQSIFKHVTKKKKKKKRDTHA